MHKQMPKKPFVKKIILGKRKAIPKKIPKTPVLTKIPKTTSKAFPRKTIS